MYRVENKLKKLMENNCSVHRSPIVDCLEWNNLELDYIITIYFTVNVIHVNMN